MSLFCRRLSPLRNYGRLKIFLAVCLLFGALYVFILNTSITSRSVVGYSTRLVKVNSTPPKSVRNHEKRVLNPVDFDISLLNYPNVTSNDADVADDSKSGHSLPLCPDLENITTYKGQLFQATLLIEDLSEEEIERVHSDIGSGGSWKPSHCQPIHKVAIIIPYRDRKSHLARLLDFLFPILQTQLLDFRFIVTEQFGEDLFNKGRIMNAAFRLAQKLGVSCVIFHDVDMFPQDDRTPYGCPPTPRHLGAFVSNLGYQLWYKEIVGGALAISMDDYLTVNGYSNLYWAWGGEDDDMGKRMLSLNYTIERPNQEYARYSMLKHVKRKRTAPKLIYKLLDSAGTRWMHDGVNEQGLWTVMHVDKRPLYYHLLVNVGEAPVYWRGQK